MTFTKCHIAEGIKMNQQKVDIFIKKNQMYFPKDDIPYLKAVLNSIDEEKFALISDIEFKDPSLIFGVSIYFGWLGIDRFMIGDIKSGILKLLTLGMFCIWTFADWFIICRKVESLNFKSVMELI